MSVETLLRKSLFPPVFVRLFPYGEISILLCGVQQGILSDKGIKHGPVFSCAPGDEFHVVSLSLHNLFRMAVRIPAHHDYPFIPDGVLTMLQITAEVIRNWRGPHLGKPGIEGNRSFRGAWCGYNDGVNVEDLVSGEVREILLDSADLVSVIAQIHVNVSLSRPEIHIADRVGFRPPGNYLGHILLAVVCKWT